MGTVKSGLEQVKRFISSIFIILRSESDRIVHILWEMWGKEFTDIDTEKGLDWLKDRCIALLTPSGAPLFEFREVATELQQAVKDIQEQEEAGEAEIEEPSFKQIDRERLKREVLSRRRRTAMNADEMTSIAGGDNASEGSPRIELRGFAVLRGITELGRKKGPKKLVVPLGQIFVLAYDFNTYGLRGIPEVYLAGEKVRKDTLRKGEECLVFALPEFPGMVYIHAHQFLFAISQTPDDTARLEISFYLRVAKPVVLLKRLGGNLEAGNPVKGEKRITEFNEELGWVIRRKLRQILSSRLQIWSGDEETLGMEILSLLNEELSRWGLRVDFSDDMNHPIILLREFPSSLYEIALQFSSGERMLFNLLNSGTNLGELSEETGLTERHVVLLQEKMQEPGGTALFTILMDAPNETRLTMAKWLERQGLGRAAKFLRELYAHEKDDVEEREIRLSEQVLLSALRNPMLTRGEWLKHKEEFDISTFQRLETRVRAAMT